MRGPRLRIYPGRVQRGRMSARQAEREITVMTAVLERLEADAGKERLL